MGVMNVKRSTQAFSKAEQTSSLKSDGTSSLSPQDQKKFFGDQNLGEVLNKVADSNWVDPSKKMRAPGNDKLDKDAFLKLMLAQMKHQDPTNPMQSHEMAAQLAQFTSLEQLNNMNTTLSAIKEGQSPNTNYQALALIGKKVSGDSSRVSRVKGDTKHSFNFDLMNDAAKVKITVRDAEGKTVRTFETGEMKKGSNSVDWNGLDDAGTAARAGEYRVTVEGVSSSGAKVFAKTNFEGRITGLNYTAEGPVLLVGKQTIRLSDVKKIEDPGIESAVSSAPSKEQSPATASPVKAQSANSSATADQNKTTNEENIPPAEEADAKIEGNIADVPMARDLQQRVAKGY